MMYDYPARIIPVKSLADRCGSHRTEWPILMITVSEVACLNPHGGTIIVSFILWFMYSQRLLYGRSTFKGTERYARTQTEFSISFHFAFLILSY